MTDVQRLRRIARMLQAEGDGLWEVCHRESRAGCSDWHYNSAAREWAEVRRDCAAFLEGVADALEARREQA